MRVTCNACHAVHDIAPPPWVVASGRPFGMQCARCGARQEVYPIGLQMLDDGSSGTYPGLGPVVVDGTPVGRPAPSPAPAPAPARPIQPAPMDAAPAHLPGTTLVDDSLPDAEQSLSMPVPFAKVPGEHDSETTLEMAAVHVHERTAVAPDQDGDTLSDADDPMPPPPEVATPSGAALLADLERDLESGGDPAEVLDATAPAVPPEAIVPLRETADELSTPPRGEGDYVLLQGGEMFDVADLATVQRWVIERRVDADDHLSFRAGPWQRAGDLEALAVFFEAVSEIEAHGGGQAASVRRPPRRPWTGLVGLGAPERTEESAAYPAVNIGLDHLDAPPVPEHLKGRPVVVPVEEDIVTVGRTKDERTEEESAAVVHAPASMAAAVAKPAPIGASAAERSFGVDDEEEEARVAHNAEGASALWMFGAATLVAVVVLGIWWVGEGSGGPVTLPVADPATAQAPAVSEAPAPGSPEAAPAAAAPAAAPAPAPAAPPAPAPAASPAPSPAPTATTTATHNPSTRVASPSRASEPPAPGPVAHLNLPTPARSLTSPPPDGPSPWDSVPTAAPAPAPAPAPSWDSRSSAPSEGPVAAVDNTARVAGLVDQGWTALDAGNASSAADYFEQATSLMPSSVDANYGLGYAYVKQGRLPEAQVRLCKARARAGATDKREIEAVLSGAGLSCE